MQQRAYILSINPGNTSTKFGVFVGEGREVREVLVRTVRHSPADLERYPKVVDQLEFRLQAVTGALADVAFNLDHLAAVAGRGGLLKPLAGGTYRVNEAMLADLWEARRGEHASNLGALMAHRLAEPLSIPSFIVDPVSVDEMDDVARLSGLPDLPRHSLSHALNMKAVARQVAARMGRHYREVNFVVAHLGSGISVVPHRRGRMVDVNNALNEGPFSPERTGTLPATELVRLCYSGRYTEREMLRKVAGEGGMYAYLGTKDLEEAVSRARSGDTEADLVIRAMAYQVAKEIGAMAAVLAGEVDRIVLTGAMAHSDYFIDHIIPRVSFIAPVVVVPGEDELPSLAQGAYRVLLGEEEAMDY